MKKLFLFIAIAIASTQHSDAQFWRLCGNANTNNNQFLGTTDNKPLRIKTNSSLRMSIAANGNVSIGDTTSVYKLNVKGIVNADSAYYLKNYAVISPGPYPNTFQLGNNQSLFAIGTNNPWARFQIDNSEGAIGIYATQRSPLPSAVFETANPSSVFPCLQSSTNGKGPAGYFKSDNPDPNSAILSARYTGIISTHNIKAIEGHATPEAGHGIGGFFTGGYMGSHSEVHTLSNYSVYGSYNIATNDGYGAAYGTVGYAGGAGSDAKYGVYGYIMPASNGITYAGYFNGNVTVTGTFSNPSDARLKKEISPVQNSIDKINSLSVKTYFYDTEHFRSMNLPSKKQTGLIAQEVEEVFPELVTENIQPAVLDSNNNVVIEAVNYKAVNYIGFIPSLISALQEQQQQIDALKNELAEIKKMISEKTSNEININKTNINASDITISPNPASERLNIWMPLLPSMPCLVKIHDVAGREVLTQQINSDQTTIDISSLLKGNYFLQIISNNNVICTKSVVVAK
jgi:hypothetical protein